MSYLPIYVAVSPVVSAMTQFLLVVGLVFLVLTLATSFMRFQILTNEAGKDEDQTEADDALHLCVIRKLSLIRRDVDAFSLIMLGVKEHLAVTLSVGDTEDFRHWFEACIQRVSRKSDHHFIYRGRHIGIVSDIGRESVRIIAERLRDEIARSPYENADGQVVTFTPVMGVVTYPENGTCAYPLIQLAFDAMQSDPEGGICIVDEETYPVQPEEQPEDTGANAKLVDPLTGVLRSDRVALTFQKYISRYRKDDQAVSLLYLDVDALRRYNDHYGEPAGDALLKGVGKVLQDHLRESDLLGRYDGEEFIVAMPCVATDALCAAVRIAAEIRNHEVVYDHHHLKVTACIGIAGFPDHGVSAGQIFDAADSALQAAKSKGQAVCEIYEEHMKTKMHDKHIADVF